MQTKNNQMSSTQLKPEMCRTYKSRIKKRKFDFRRDPTWFNRAVRQLDCFDLKSSVNEYAKKRTLRKFYIPTSNQVLPNSLRKLSRPKSVCNFCKLDLCIIWILRSGTTSSNEFDWNSFFQFCKKSYKIQNQHYWIFSKNCLFLYSSNEMSTLPVLTHFPYEVLTYNIAAYGCKPIMYSGTSK